MKRLIPILLLLVSGVAHAEESITGAFGLKFGEVLDESIFDVTFGLKNDGYLEYSYKPKVEINPFTTYTVYVTPVKRLVFKIYAGDRISGGCDAHYFALETVLSMKYGMYDVTTDFDYKRAIWGSKDDRSIVLFCNISGDMALFYTDAILANSATDELIQEAEEKAGDL